MPVAVGYTYDIVLSYAHVDDRPVPGAEDDKGWVTIFYETLRIEVQKRLGRTDVELWKDDELSYQSFARQLFNSVRASAILIVMLSPGYIHSDWSGRSAFMRAVRGRGDAPVFVVAKEWIADAAVPEELRDYRHFPFFSGSENDWATFGHPRPNPADPRHAPFYDNIFLLSREICAVLNKPAAPSPPSNKRVKPAASSPPSNKRVFLAQTTEDVERERDMVRALLGQQGVEVLPLAYYPLEPNAFRAAVERDMQAADVFVQLLGGIAGKRPAGLPQGYPRLQWELATGLAEAGKSLPILQWCSPSLDISLVNDEQHAGFLRTATVRQESLVDFQRAILAALEPPKRASFSTRPTSPPSGRQPKIGRPATPVHSSPAERLGTEKAMVDIFISYTRKDRVKAQKLAKALERRGWTVWWDTRLRAGEIWDEVIETQLKAARAAIVLWSESSVKSRWVKKEARVADERRILAPAFLQVVELPLEFSDVQAADLIDWEGDQAHPGFARLIEDITAMLARPRPR